MIHCFLWVSLLRKVKHITPYLALSKLPVIDEMKQLIQPFQGILLWHTINNSYTIIEPATCYVLNTCFEGNSLVTRLIPFLRNNACFGKKRVAFFHFHFISFFKYIKISVVATGKMYRSNIRTSTSTSTNTSTSTITKPYYYLLILFFLHSLV